MNYTEDSIKVLSEDEAAKHSPFGIAHSLSIKYPLMDSKHCETISETLFLTGIDITLYERRYCSPLNAVADDIHFTAAELDTLSELLEAFKDISKRKGK
ncbi:MULTISPECIES: hypothetical protein [Klebsiella pneumoniae complex]|uniref:hypothetical protein n=1 Tax=Klebsiella pneumoniae complex TaxID=3390273 RepID=UPI002AB91E0D|nr:MULTISPECIES: hypothetical protein [Klebsiella]MDZ3401942.1 hypothetical protein [Klebsiella quasipneumoniae]HBQ2518326.1 hypothetical protein [Klebsiella pneumoniae]HBU7049560.1 hypothetical protein [Klebsiella pneumoniae]HBZ0104853.1 hypothetical protein [Klebsiella pneumoniae]